MSIVSADPETDLDHLENEISELKGIEESEDKDHPHISDEETPSSKPVS